MSLEEALSKNTAALDRNSDLIEKMVAKAAGKAPAAAEGDAAPAARRRVKSEADAEKPKADAEKPKADAEKEDPDAIYKMARGFMDFGDENNADDEDERDRRTGFVKKLLRHFDVEKARDIPPRNQGKIKRWFKLFAEGEKVDFETD